MTGAPFPLGSSVAAMLRDGTSEVLPSGGRPIRVDGFTVGAPLMEHNPPHRGEVHPDGDELLYVVSGRVEVVLDDGDQDTVGAETRTEVVAGQAFLVPQGVWHRVDVKEPTHLVHITPGPGDGHRPL